MVYQPNWKKGEIIRNITSGKPYQVIHIFHIGINATATMLIDLEERVDPTPPLVLQQRAYDEYVRDFELDIKNNGEVLQCTKLEW